MLVLPEVSQPMRTILRVFQYIRRYPWLAVGTVGFAVLATLMVIVFPAVTQRVIDEAIRGQKPELILPLALLAAAAFFVQSLSDGIRIILNNTFEQKVIFDLRSDLYNHIQKLPLRWFDNSATGDIMTRVLEDVNAMERVLIDGVEQGTVAILQVLIVGVILFLREPWLATLTMLPIPLLVTGALIYTLTAKSRYRLQRQAASAMNSLLHDNLSGVRQIKAYVRERQEHHRFNEMSMRLKEATLVVMKAWALYSPAMDFLTSCGLVIVTGFGGLAVLHGRMPIGELVACLILVRFLYEPIGRLHALNQMLQSARAAADRVFQILDEPAEVDFRERFDPVGRIEYRDVSFAYAEGQPVLKHIAFVAEPGQTIALVGATGAGKSTLVNLLLRFYELGPGGGDILIDDRSIRDLSKHAIRNATGFVSQESFLFNGTIRENLLFARSDASESEIWNALRAANAEEFVSRLPTGLDSSVGERGIRLSVGEKQRISIARAILKDPPMLVLDEATASVDTETERQIQEALNRLLMGRTSFVIAHRLSTVRHADQILVLDGGQIVERGDHEQLLELDGIYAKLCQSGLFFVKEEAEPEHTELLET
ncbi:MAG TPA: ABC transporter ATP-binding protein [Chthoniobacterales bacterium]|jgi:ABC-type multidrug transport system fused ATPase/permease subunit